MQIAVGKSDSDTLLFVRKKPYDQWIIGTIVVALVGMITWSLWTNPRLEKGVIWQYLFSELVLRGVLLTLELTAITFSFGIILGLPLALMARSRNPVLRGVAWLYMWIFRSVPPLVQIIVWAFLAALYPKIEIGLPFLGDAIWSANTNDVIKPFVAAIIGFSLIEAAYQAEVFRAGLLAVPSSQHEAALALGYSRVQAFTRIILPQAMPSILPPSANNVIILLKGTSLVSVEESAGMAADRSTQSSAGSMLHFASHEGLALY
jgi:polar amino acid transport system permease protein